MARLAARASTGNDRTGRLRTLQTLVKSVVGYALFFVFALTVLQTLDVNITGIVTTAGVAGIAVGFGAQKLVRDVISGFFIVSEDHFAVGDFVTVGPATGVVEELTLRTTRVRDEQGRVWVVPNGEIGFVLNKSRGPVCGHVEISVPPICDLSVLAEIVAEAGGRAQSQRPDLIVSAPRYCGVAGFDAAGVTVRIALPCRPDRLTDAQMALRGFVRDALIERGLLPMPQPPSAPS